MTTSFSSKEALFCHLDGFSAEDKALVLEWAANEVGRAMSAMQRLQMLLGVRAAEADKD